MESEPRLVPEPPGGTSPRSTLRRSVQLIAGLVGWGLAIALFIRSDLGLGPWDAFHYGLHLQLGFSVGLASILTGVVIVLATTASGLRPGAGTLANMVLVGAFTDLFLVVVPPAGSLALQIPYFAVALLLTGVGSGMYIGAGFGSGPRDGLMMTLAQRTGGSVQRARTMIEAVALAFGWAMGAPVGVGTVVIVLTIGPVVQWGLALFGALPGSSGAQGGHAGRTRRSLRKAA